MNPKRKSLVHALHHMLLFGMLSPPEPSKLNACPTLPGMYVTPLSAVPSFAPTESFAFPSPLYPATLPAGDTAPLGLCQCSYPRPWCR